MKTKAILFDLDGVLIDAADWHYHALNAALKVYGFPEINYKRHLENFNGLPTKVKLEILRIPEDKWNDIIAMKQEALDSEIQFSCKPDPEKLDLLFQLSKKYLIACCSNAVRRSVFMMLGNAELLPYFDLIVGNDDGFMSKPDPDIYHGAMSLLNVADVDCVIVEDSPKGLQAAHSANPGLVIEAQYRNVNIKLFKNYNLL